MRLSYLLLAVPAFAAPARRSSGSCTPANGTAVTPKTVVLEGSRLVDIKKHPDPTALQNLVTQADAWLTVGPWTVTSKNVSVPDGTK